MLEIKNVYKTFNPGTVNQKVALNDLNLTLEDGDFVTVIGGNGAGKSTMLNAVAGVWPVDMGKIIIDGKDIPFPFLYLSGKGGKPVQLATYIFLCSVQECFRLSYLLLQSAPFTFQLLYHLVGLGTKRQSQTETTYENTKKMSHNFASISKSSVHSTLVYLEDT